MLRLRENETIIKATRKHWIIIAGHMGIAAILLVAGILVLFVLDSPLADHIILAEKDVFAPVTAMLFSLYLMIILAYALLMLMDFYLDVWIVTNQRIIDVEQITLFSRQVSEIPLARVQDVTIEVHGILETLFKFGNIRIQTAGEREFTIASIPHLYELKDAILSQARVAPPTPPVARL